ncbi:hypothetical protein OR571_14465 [Psychrobacillus sp. NEAU-3TGS]|uniref:hypothetical protein n=1 Tax=Psychrobacillus sp. NEAU-3TGS TaxID=2995412 RepID=UPI0024980B36|nr:hypothetical protein [Psychrobacillus sp. NEAU-3TGS]MDI2588283.1 hypothetical protein [Psychrobacillus sp. NEAU-3TGS]
MSNPRRLVVRWGDSLAHVEQRLRTPNRVATPLKSTSCCPPQESTPERKSIVIAYLFIIDLLKTKSLTVIGLGKSNKWLRAIKQLSKATNSSLKATKRLLRATISSLKATKFL